jgi:tetratricopeptide (TPR) repeat protein
MKPLFLAPPVLIGLLALTLPGSASQDAGAPAAQDADAPVRLGATDGMDQEVVELVRRVADAVDAARARTDYADDAERRVALGNAHADLGLAYEANTLWTEALACYRVAARLLPDKPEWRYRAGVCEHALGDLEAALETFREVALELANTAVVQARLGDTALGLGLVEEADKAWTQAIESEKKLEQPVRFPESRVGLALVRVEQERYEEAEGLLNEALSLDPSYRHAHYVLGLVYRDTGREKEALIALQRGLRAYPSFPPDPHRPRLDGYATGFNRRMMNIENMLAAGQVQPAMEALQMVLETRPDDHFALNLLSRCYQFTQQFDKALEVLERSEAANPMAYQTFVEQAVVLLNLANQQAEDPEKRAALLGEAAAKAETAIRIAPLMGRPYYYRGLVELMGANGVEDQQVAGQKMQAAMSYMQRAHLLGCQEPQLFEYLAQLYANMNRTREMVQFAKEHVAHAPDNPNAWVFLARAQYTVKNFDEAITAAEQAAATSGGNPQVANFVQQLRAAIEEQRQQEPTPAPGGDGQ